MESGDCLGKDAHAAELGPPAAAQLLARDVVELGERLGESRLEELRGGVVVELRAARGLRDDRRRSTPSSRQWKASGLNAAAAFFASPASRQRIAAQPSGVITE